MSKFRGIKIRVTPETSGAVQEALFAEGIKWFGDAVSQIQKTECPFLYVYQDGYIRYGDSEKSFLSEKYQEVFFETTTTITVKLLPPAEVIEFNGKKYLKEDLEKALALLTPLS